MCSLVVEVGRAAGERNFQREGDRYKENITLKLSIIWCRCAKVAASL